MKKLYLQFIYQVLAFYARIVIRKYRPTIIAITGTVGKTSTKEAVYQVLADAFPGKVRKSEGNLNAEIGIPLSILGYKSLPNKFLWSFFLIGALSRLNQKNYPKYLVLEMGVEHAGDLASFTSIAKPDYAIITAVGSAHLSNFKTEKEYQKEKLSIITSVPLDGKIIINYDDPILLPITGKRIISVAAKNRLADYHAEDVRINLKGSEFRICCSGHKIAIKSHVLGAHIISSSIFAFAIANIFGVSLIKAGKSLEKIMPFPGRMSPIEGENSTSIIDDTYNANPGSVKAALITLSEISHKGRKVLILGNMNELGDNEKKSHEEIGAFARGRCEFAVFTGQNAGIMQKGYGDKSTSMVFKDRRELVDKIDDIIKKDDLILIKASQNGNYFEEVTKHLMKNPEKADKLLVRQDRFWLRKK